VLVLNSRAVALTLGLYSGKVRLFLPVDVSIELDGFLVDGPLHLSDSKRLIEEAHKVNPALGKPPLCRIPGPRHKTREPGPCAAHKTERLDPRGLEPRPANRE